MVKRICMIVQNPMVKGGIAAVVNGYYGSELEQRYEVSYIQSYKDGNKLQKIWKAIKAYCKYFNELIWKRPNLLHVHSSFGGSFYRQIPFIYLSNWFHVPVINHIHGPEFDKFYTQASENKKKVIKKVYNRCACLITLSEEWKENFLKVVPEEKICVIENYSTLVNDIDYTARKVNQVLFLGAINERKGCYDIPEIVAKVVKNHPELLLVIAGDGEQENIKALLEGKGVKKNCIFPGWVRDKEKDRLLRESSFFFLPSYNEGMPMAILDAMGYSLPIITTNVGGIPKIVDEGENGFMFTPGDVEGMAQAIERLLGNQKQARQMGEKSFSIVNERYTLDIHFNKLFNLYERILDK